MRRPRKLLKAGSAEVGSGLGVSESRRPLSSSSGDSAFVSNSSFFFFFRGERVPNRRLGHVSLMWRCLVTGDMLDCGKGLSSLVPSVWA